MTSANPAYPDAHPTAPGGMSRKALIEELTTKHGYEIDGDGDWDGVSWPDLIQYVIEARRDAERPDDLDDTERIEVETDHNDTLDSIYGAADMFPDDLTPEGWDNDVQPVNPDNHGDYAGEGEPYMDTEGDFDDSEQIEEVLAALEEAESNDMFDDLLDEDRVGLRQSYEFTPDLGANKAAAVPLDEDGVLDPEVMFAEMFAAREAVEAAQPAPIFLGIPGVKDYIFDGHAGAGPSGAERWMNCTMSLSASRAFLETLTPNQQREVATGTLAARQGTTAHAVGESKVNHMLGRIDDDALDFDLLELAVSPAEGEEFDSEMDEYTDEYLDLVRSFAQERGDDAILVESVVEAAIPLTGIHADETYMIRGSVDFAASPSKAHPVLVVGDLKYGNGLDVDVEANPQIRLYALAILMLLADEETGELPDWLETVDYYIIQPRLGGIKKWSESIDDLLQWRDEVLAPALTEALYGRDEGGATYTPSDLACQWCPARGSCPALAEHVMTKGSELFDAIQDAEFIDGPGALPLPEKMDNDTLGDLLLQIRDLEKLQKSMREEAQRRLHRGEKVKNFHLVNHTPKRTWKAGAEEQIKGGHVEGLTLNKTKELFTEPSLVSPTAAEKILGDGYATIEPLVNKPAKIPLISTGPKDRRKAWEGKAPEDMFADDITTGETDG